MYSGELEVQAKRRAIAVLQDEINRILNAARELATLPESILRKDKVAVKNSLEQISSIEDEVEHLRRKITREVADVGGLIMNRENLLNTHIPWTRLQATSPESRSRCQISSRRRFRVAKLDKDMTGLIELVVDEIYKLNEVIRNLSSKASGAIELAQETQAIERDIDTRYRNVTIKLLNEISDTKELLLFKDVIESIEEMADKCQKISDSFILLALSL